MATAPHCYRRCAYGLTYEPACFLPAATAAPCTDAPPPPTTLLYLLAPPVTCMLATLVMLLARLPGGCKLLLALPCLFSLQTARQYTLVSVKLHVWGATADVYHCQSATAPELSSAYSSRTSTARHPVCRFNSPGARTACLPVPNIMMRTCLPYDT